jgi:hypothetical protein
LRLDISHIPHPPPPPSDNNFRPGRAVTIADPSNAVLADGAGNLCVFSNFSQGRMDKTIPPLIELNIGENVWNLFTVIPPPPPPDLKLKKADGRATLVAVSTAGAVTTLRQVGEGSNLVALLAKLRKEVGGVLGGNAERFRQSCASAEMFVDEDLLEIAQLEGALVRCVGEGGYNFDFLLLVMSAPPPLSDCGVGWGSRGR